MGEHGVSTAACSDVAEALAGVAAGELTLSTAERSHVDHCLRCQAQVVQHRKILRTMRQLRDDVIEPAQGLLPDMLAQVHDIGERSAVRSLVGRQYFRYSVAIAGLGVAAATGTVLTIRWRRSSDRAPQGSASALGSGSGDAAPDAG